jgi:hypothetical protein
MASAAQIRANRANALRSTGPRTAKGKARSARNALTHGAFSATALLSDESKAAFHALRASYLALFRPANQNEYYLVGRLAFAAWRLNRLADLEPRLVRDHQYAAIHQAQPEFDAPVLVAPDSIAHAYIRDSERGNAIFKLARYQTTIERSYFRVLHELQGLRSASKPPA